MSDIKEQLKELQEKSFVVIESSNLNLGSDNKGGRVKFDDAFYSARQMNPLRQLASERSADGASSVAFVSKVGNAIAGAINPWGENVQANAGSPNIDTAFWSLPKQTVSAQLPIRTAVLQDITQLEDAVTGDLMAELFTLEGQSMAQNNDQPASVVITGQTNPVASGGGFNWTVNVGSTAGFAVGQFATVSGNGNAALNGYYQVVGLTANTNLTLFYPTNPGTYTTGALSITNNNQTLGGLKGLRGLDSYVSAGGAPAAGATTAAAYGTTGYGQGFGLHSVATYGIATQATVTYNDITNIVNALPPQYWMMEGTTWQIHPSMITQLRQIKDTAGLPVFLEIGDYDAAAVGMMFGFPVIPNANLSSGAGAGKFPIYLANWPRALEIADDGPITLKVFEETQPGTSTIFAQKRVVSTVKDPFAIVRARTVA